VRDLEHLKNVVDRIQRGRRNGAKVLSTRTVIVLGRTRPPAVARFSEPEPEGRATRGSQDATTSAPS
jgi:hypothetical protein